MGSRMVSGHRRCKKSRRIANSSKTACKNISTIETLQIVVGQSGADTLTNKAEEVTSYDTITQGEKTQQRLSRLGRDIVLSDGLVILNVSKSINVDKGKRTRFWSDVLLFQQAKPPCSFTKEETGYLTKRIQDGVTEVVQAKARAGSATLSMAYAAVKFADRYLRGLRGDVDIVDCAFIESRVTELPFFATQVRLGHTGVEEIYQLGPLNEYERAGLEES
ncbi:hypothetical protein M8C21_002835 [Ambrosia artemisiifolia]|uniref:Lactate/malate dehydrogenase C-terminal domain-containing protein n=1 Tax=Ambrosia artemisiifolia TaxID=4212 RepID=A0AAD5CVR9_AMBAR|nr:hypothetical protein M8C21_002835 [Ambrosia artemisiifolia]